MRSSGRALPFTLAAAILFVLMIAPLVFLLAAVPPGAVAAAFSAAAGLDALRTSLAASAMAAGTATALGVPGGYALAHAGSGVRSVGLWLLAMPLAFPPVASGIMLLETIGTRTPIGSSLAAHGITLVDSFWGVALAEFFVSGSFVAIVSAAAFASLDTTYEEAARTMGAGPFAIFFRIALPLAAPTVVAGVLLSWMRAMGEYGATSIVAYHPTALPVQLYVTLSAQGVGPALALAYGFVVLAAIVVAMQWALRGRIV